MQLHHGPPGAGGHALEAAVGRLTRRPRGEGMELNTAILVGALTGGLAGAVLNSVVSWLREERRKAFVGKNVRKLLELEIDQNVDELIGFEAAVDRRSARIAEVRHAHRRDGLRDVVLPSFSHSRWDSLAPLIAEHLPSDKLKLVEAHHRALKFLEANKATRLEDRSDENWYPDQEKFIAKVKQIGNPLK